MEPLFHPPANSAKSKPPNGWLWYVCILLLCNPIKFGPLDAIWLWLTPPKKSIFFRIITATKQSCLSIPRPIWPKPSHPMVDCGMFEYFNWVHWLNLARWTGSSNGNTPPKRWFFVEFCRPQIGAAFPSTGQSAKAQPPNGWFYF